MSDNKSGCVATIVNNTSFTMHRTGMRKWTENNWGGDDSPWWEPEPPETIAAGTSTTFGNGLNAWVSCCGEVTYVVRSGSEDLFACTAFWRITSRINPAPHTINLYVGDGAEELVNIYWDPEWESARLRGGAKPKVKWTFKEWPE